MDEPACNTRVALITGASRGLGAAIAREFTKAAYDVFISGLDPAEVEEAVADLSKQAREGSVGGVAGDISNPAFGAKLFDSAIDRFGRLDALVCNAGVDVIKPALDYAPDEWDFILNVNLKGTFFLCQAAARQWVAKSRRDVSITMTSSIAGSVGIANLAPYAASKGGMNQLVRTLALEWAEHGIRVNAVAPGYLQNIMAGATVHDDPATAVRIARDTPLGRRAELREAAEAVLFLASPGASYVTGAILPVDGGYTAR